MSDITPKRIQIDFKTFSMLAQYFLLENRSEALERQIKTSINIKLDAMLKHELYTQYKTAPTEKEREKARQEYLEKIGMQKDFIWSKEYDNKRK